MARSDSKQRRRILDAAISVFAEEGLPGATIRRVGQRAGVNSALIYYYFEDKRTLFADAVRLVMEGFLEHVVSGRRDFRGARDRLSFLVNSAMDYYTRHADRMHLMAVAFSLYPDILGRVLSAFLREHAAVPVEIIRDGVECGDLRDVSPVHAWWSILGLCLFSLNMKEIMQHAELGGVPFESFDPDERKSHVLDLLMRGMARGAGGGPKSRRSGNS